MLVPNKLAQASLGTYMVPDNHSLKVEVPGWIDIDEGILVWMDVC